MSQRNVFRRPRTVRDYGYLEGRPIEQEGSASGFLLGWDAIDDAAEAIANRRPPRYVVTGEWVRPDGVRFPELAMSREYMDWAGYVQNGPFLAGGGDLPPRKSWRPKRLAGIEGSVT